jgi:SWI/SNF chromatin-remodeling complex subunit SWI1
MSPNPVQAPGFDTTNNYFAGLDPAAAKQMAAMNDANRPRMANTRPNILPGIGSSPAPFLPGNQSMGLTAPAIAHDLSGLPAMVGNPSNFQPSNHPSIPQHVNSATNPALLDPAMSQPNMAARQMANSNQQSAFLRQRNFLAGLASVMTRRGTPLPPALTGVASNYDPNDTPWKSIETSPGQIGSFRLAGKDVDLLKLWSTVFPAGGGAKVCSVFQFTSLSTLTFLKAKRRE